MEKHDTHYSKKPNRLINEKSPYLLQHAHNPVDWYPWGEEAFQKAKQEEKPVFLSIGYSTCHWCHVMENESFEDREVAEILNRYFVSIKVDKEERPDINSVYMTTCQAVTGQGGWPLTIIMTPEQKPFFAGTYLPKTARYNIRGLLELLTLVKDLWKSNREELLTSSDKITEILKQQNQKSADGDILSKDIAKRSFSVFCKIFDKEYGGFGSKPKFPAPHQLMFLLRYYHLENDYTALKMVEKTLKQLYKGGIFDHIGYGFSRYSTDDKWLVPHFEKMLYDNALLTITYLEAYQITHNEFYKMVATDIMEYVLRELTDISGGFYCAQDADSEGEEGKFYVFTPSEIEALLGSNDGKYFNKHFDITEHGNFEGKNIPNLLNSDDYDKKDKRIESLLPKVFAYREKRTSLHKDDKILTSWTSLMIVAFAKAYKILKNDRYLQVALDAVHFIEDKMTDGNGRLLVSYRKGNSSGMGLLNDYAFYVWALLEMYEAAFEPDFLQKALKFQNDMISLFWDNENHGFFMYAKNSEQLIYRPKELYDEAIPSGNSVAAYNLIKLAKFTGKSDIDDIASKQLEFLAGSAADYPVNYSFFTMALMLALYPSKEIVCVVENKSGVKQIKKIIHDKFLPNTTIIIKDAENAEKIEAAAEFTKGYDLKNGKDTVYICKNNACSPPLNITEELIERF